MAMFINGRVPFITTNEIDALLTQKRVEFDKTSVAVIGLRGYFPAIGMPNVNDRGFYDDVIVVRSPSVLAVYNGNTDPSGYRFGLGLGEAKGMAYLITGTWWYRPGWHKQTPAFVQAEPVTVRRDGKDGDYFDQGWFGINIHKGGTGDHTGSEGCQTLPPDQWPSFFDVLHAELRRAQTKVFPYILVDTKIDFKPGSVSQTTDADSIMNSTIGPGSSGPYVKALQLILQSMVLEVLPTVTPDGFFGPVTEAHVKKFQKVIGLKPTGICDPKTWAALQLWIEQAKLS